MSLELEKRSKAIKLFVFEAKLFVEFFFLPNKKIRKVLESLVFFFFSSVN
jgi:hypothetical protein